METEYITGRKAAARQPTTPPLQDRVRAARAAVYHKRAGESFRRLRELHRIDQGSLTPEQRHRVRRLCELLIDIAAQDFQRHLDALPPTERAKRIRRIADFNARQRLARTPQRARQRGGAVARPEQRARAARPATNARVRGSRRTSSGGTPDDDPDKPGEHPGVLAACEAGCGRPRVGRSYCAQADCIRARARERKRAQRQRDAQRKRQGFAPWTRGLSRQEIKRVEKAEALRRQEERELERALKTDSDGLPLHPREAAKLNHSQRRIVGAWESKDGTSGIAETWQRSRFKHNPALSALDVLMQRAERQTSPVALTALVYKRTGDIINPDVFCERGSVDSRPPSTAGGITRRDGAPAYMRRSRQGVER